MAWWKKFLAFLGVAALGGLFIRGGCSLYLDARRHALEAASTTATGPGPLLFAITLLLAGVLLLFLAFSIISPGDLFELDDGFFWAYGMSGIPRVLAVVVSLLLPPLFLWQLWVLLTENLLKGYPPIAWGRIGGVTSDWVIFCVMLIPWLLIAGVGIIWPVCLFWKGIKRGY